MATAPETLPRTRSRRSLPLGTAVRHAVLILFCLVAIVPVLWVFSISLKTVSEAYTLPQLPAPASLP